MFRVLTYHSEEDVRLLVHIVNPFCEEERRNNRKRNGSGMCS